MLINVAYRSAGLPAVHSSGLTSVSSCRQSTQQYCAAGVISSSAAEASTAQ
jgi:hypothetical protein